MTGGDPASTADPGPTSADRRSMAARRLGAAAVLVAALATTALLADHLLAARRASANAARIQALEASVKTDADEAAALHEERRKQTASSLGRDGRARLLSWLLLAASAGFVAAASWERSLRPRRVPPLDAIVAARLPALSGERGAFARPASRAPGGEPPSAPRADDVEPATDLAFVDELVERFGRGPEAAIPMLQAVQARYRYLPDEVLRRVVARTEITPAQLAGSSTFYARFRHAPVGRHVVRVCHGTACHVAGAAQISQELRRHLGIPEGADTDARKLFTLDEVACVGCCSLAPVIVVEEATAGRLTPASARAAVDAVTRT
jgi:NADH:ubiquinone oxidoreductase subunit E